MNTICAVVVFKSIQGHRAEVLAHGMWDRQSPLRLAGTGVNANSVSGLVESAKADAAAGYGNLLFADGYYEMLLSPAFAEAGYNGLQLIVASEQGNWIPTISSGNAMFAEGIFDSMESAQAAAVRRAAALLGVSVDAGAVRWNVSQ